MGGMRFMVNARGLECTGIQPETKLVLVLLYISEAMIWRG